MERCLGCEIALGRRDVAGGVHPVAPGWTLNANLEETGRPRFVLQPDRHVAHLDELTDEERAVSGELAARATGYIKELLGAELVYVLLLNEKEPRHLHIHLIPRFKDDAKDVRGPGLINVPRSGGPLAHQVVADVAALIVEDTKHIAPPVPGRASLLVALLVGLCRLAQSLTPYRWMRVPWRYFRLPLAELANVYVIAWLAVLITLLAYGPTPTWDLDLGLLPVAAGLYRLADIATFYLGVLLDRDQRSFQSFERSLALLILNAAEICVALAVLLRASGVSDRTDALYEGFMLLTLMQAPSTGVEHIRSTTVAGVALGVLMLIVALSVFVGAIGQRFRAEA